MLRYVVLFRTEKMSLADPPLAHVCKAENGGQAEENCMDTHPDCDVVWVYENARSNIRSIDELIDLAYIDYYKS